MNILALDFGTHTGFCYSSPAGLISGTWTLGSKKEITAWGKERLTRRRDPRVVRLFEFLKVVKPLPDLVVFEDVEFQTYTYQTQLWSAFRTAAWLAFPPGVVMDCVPVGVLKKFATGHGGADKALMAKYLTLTFPEFTTAKMDDNEIDAIWIFKWAEKNLSRMVK